MTRINCIDPELLLDEHVLAELREINRVPNTILSGKAKVVLRKIPKDYRMGAGHVTYFYNKLGYISKRYESLYKEAVKRGFNVQYTPTSLEALSEVHKAALCNNWVPSAKDREVNIQRIQERFDLRKRGYHFNRKVVESLKEVLDTQY